MKKQFGNILNMFIYFFLVFILPFLLAIKLLGFWVVIDKVIANKETEA